MWRAQYSEVEHGEFRFSVYNKTHPSYGLNDLDFAEFRLNCENNDMFLFLTEGTDRKRHYLQVEQSLCSDESGRSERKQHAQRPPG